MASTATGKPTASQTRKVSKPLANGRRTTRIQRVNEEKILEAAIAVFSSYGLRGSTIDQIAAGAGMSKPNLLYYFKSKRAIYVAAIERTLDVWLNPLTLIDPHGDPAVEIGQYIERKLELSRTNPAASQLFANEILHGAGNIEAYLKTSLKDLVDQKCRVLKHWMDEGRLVCCEPVHLIFMIWATTQHYADFESQIALVDPGDRNTRFNTARDTLNAVFLEGLKPRKDED